ncbi:MAG: hypothetical protein FWD61_06030 [Phycisphaerales bacterium]|nr:hypothetical protein [Phycisphaerales bacterium]
MPKSVPGYFAAHGQVPWFINGIAFAGGIRVSETGPLSPMNFLRTLLHSRITTWRQEKEITDSDGSRTIIYYPVNKEGVSLLAPGGSPLFGGLTWRHLPDRLNFVSLMLALAKNQCPAPRRMDLQHRGLREPPRPHHAAVLETHDCCRRRRVDPRWLGLFVGVDPALRGCVHPDLRAAGVPCGRSVESTGIGNAAAVVCCSDRS